MLPNAKEGGHGDHWGCLLRSVQEKELIPFLTEVTRKDDHPYTFSYGPGSTEKGLAFYSKGEPLRACVLVANKMLASAYPEVQDGPVWPITITGDHTLGEWAGRADRRHVPWCCCRFLRHTLLCQLAAVRGGADVRLPHGRAWVHNGASP